MNRNENRNKEEQMTQEERLEFLIQYLIQESPEYRDVIKRGRQNQPLSYTPSEAPGILRSLMNLRPPYPVSEEFLDIQDAYLKEETRRRGIVELDTIPTVRESLHSTHRYADRICVWQGDITRLQVSALVNAANSQMLGCFVPCHGCIDNAIHSAAGIQLRRECAAIMDRQKHPEPTGRAKITRAYNLPCRHVIHTVGPIVGWKLTENDCEFLRSCYRSCMELADAHHLESLAFSCISTGEFHFPGDRAAKIAIETVGECLEHSGLRRVIFNVFKDQDREFYESLL